MPTEKKKPAAPVTPLSPALAAKPVSHFMQRKLITVTPSTTVRTAMKTMLAHNISGLIVVNASLGCVGIYSEFDAMLQGSAEDLDRPIKFSKPPIVVSQNTPFKEALVALVKKRVKRLPVLDARKKIVGLLSRQDFMKAIFEDQANEKTK